MQRLHFDYAEKSVEVELVSMLQVYRITMHHVRVQIGETENQWHCASRKLSIAKLMEEVKPVALGVRKL